MIAIGGVVLVILSILGGYLLEHGNILVLIQPAELLIIGGAGLGTLLIANPLSVIKAIVAGLPTVIKGSPYTRSFYLDTLRMLNQLFGFARKEGAAKLEQEIDNPEQGQILSRYPAFLKNHFARDFICDTIRMSLAGNISPHDLDHLMETDAEIHKHEAETPVHALTTVADSLPGLGIVAAVLGVVITMGALSGPPEQIGHKVAAALVGTFLGILLCYGFVGPLAAHIGKINQESNHYHQVLRIGTIGYLKGMPPILATESARRMIPHHQRPSMREMEEWLKNTAAASVPAAEPQTQEPA